VTQNEREAKRRADDARNGCAQKPKPAGDPKALILARLPATRAELRERTGLSNADAKAALSGLLRSGAVTTVDGVYLRR
jgi:hypothetical protein